MDDAVADTSKLALVRFTWNARVP